MEISEITKALSFGIIKHFEGLKYEAYKCPAGVWTIGIGHTKNVKPSDKITTNEALKLLWSDLEENSAKLDNLQIKVSDYQLAALLSLSFNLSTKSITNLVNYLNSDVELFKSKMLQYCNANGKPLIGLQIRRIAERLLFEEREWERIAGDLQKHKSIDYNKKIIKELFT